MSYFIQSPYWGWGLKVSKQLNVPLIYISRCSLPQLPQRSEEQLPSETRMSLLGTPCHKPHPKLKQENSLESPSSLDPPSPQIQLAHQHRQGRLVTSTNMCSVSAVPSYPHKAPGRHTRQAPHAHFAKEGKTVQGNTEAKASEPSFPSSPSPAAISGFWRPPLLRFEAASGIRSQQARTLQASY